MTKFNSIYNTWDSGLARSPQTSGSLQYLTEFLDPLSIGHFKQFYE